MEASRLALVKSIYYRIIDSVFRLTVWLHEAGSSIFNFRRHFFLNWDLMVLDWDS